MSSLDATRLSAIGAAIDDVTDRVTELIESVGTDGIGDAGVALLEAERSLTIARRALDRAQRAVRG